MKAIIRRFRAWCWIRRYNDGCEWVMSEVFLKGETTARVVSVVMTKDDGGAFYLGAIRTISDINRASYK